MRSSALQGYNGDNNDMTVDDSAFLLKEPSNAGYMLFVAISAPCHECCEGLDFLLEVRSARQDQGKTKV